MGMKVCKSGHKYDDSLPECPYCPKGGSNLSATVIDGQGAEAANPFQASGAATRIVSSDDFPSPVDMGGNNNPVSNSASRRTMIGSAPVFGGSESVSQPLPSTETNKLVGWLVTFSWNPMGDDYRVREGKTHIGADPSQDIYVDDAIASGEHATLLSKNNVLKIKDNFSSNGTQVNGEDIEDVPRVLKDGDSIKLGNTEFKLRLIAE